MEFSHFAVCYDSTASEFPLWQSAFWVMVINKEISFLLFCFPPLCQSGFSTPTKMSIICHFSRQSMSTWASWIFDSVIMVLASTVGVWTGWWGFYWLCSREIYQCLSLHFQFLPEKFVWQFLRRKSTTIALNGLLSLSFSRNYKIRTMNISRILCKSLHVGT